MPRLLTHRLDDLRLIRVAGVDRASFLQGQLTQDVKTVNAAKSALYGWATAQGRLLAVGQIFDWRDAFWLTAPLATAATLLPRLRMFVLRAKVTVELSDVAACGVSGVVSEAGFSIGDTSLPFEPLAAVSSGDSLVARVGGDPGRALLLGDHASISQMLAGLEMESGPVSEWRRADVRTGLPWIGIETSETFTPQMVNLDLIGAVSFDKGCYTGQEIVTRTRHLGRVKRRMLRFRCAGAEPPAPGHAIFGPEREAGRVVISTATPEGAELLAVTQLEEATGPLFIEPARRCGLLRLDLPYRIPDVGGS